jgi:hypothetical protein
MEKINIRAVLSEVNAPNAVFEIEYRKRNGDYGHKKRAMLRTQLGNGQRRKMNRNGLLMLVDLETKQDFDLVIDYIIGFNGCEVDI